MLDNSPFVFSLYPSPSPRFTDFCKSVILFPWRASLLCLQIGCLNKAKYNFPKLCFSQKPIPPNLNNIEVNDNLSWAYYMPGA